MPGAGSPPGAGSLPGAAWGRELLATQQRLENSQPSCPGARLCLPWAEGRQAAPRAPVRLRALMESRQLLRDNQR